MTIRSVAKLAGVSDTTVARVMDGHPYVSEEVLHKVQKAMDKLGYQPKRRASHKKARTGYVSLLLMKWSKTYLQQPLMAQIMMGVESELQKHNFATGLKSGSRSESFAGYGFIGAFGWCAGNGTGGSCDTAIFAENECGAHAGRPALSG